MIPHEFYRSVKSTIDSIGVDIAVDVMAANPALALKAMTLDATTGVTEALQSEDPAIVWAIQSFLERPVDPLYELVFTIGPKTTSDVSAELMTELMGAVQHRLPNGLKFPIKNYSGDTVSELPGETGWGFVRRAEVQEQMFDNQSAIRMATISVAITRDK